MKKILAALMATITVGSIPTIIQAHCQVFPIVDVKRYTDRAINSRGVLSVEGLRTYMGRYMIVTGYHVDAVSGDYVDIELDNGRTVQCVVLESLTSANTTGGIDIQFVADVDKTEGDMRRYKTVSVDKKFHGNVKDFHVYTPMDYSSISFERSPENSNVKKRLVTKKKVVDIKGNKVFIIYYENNGNLNTKAVTEAEYNNIKVNWSVVNV